MQLIRTHRDLTNSIYGLYNVQRPKNRKESCILQQVPPTAPVPVKSNLNSLNSSPGCSSSCCVCKNTSSGHVQAVQLINRFNEFMNNDTVYIALVSIIVISVILLLCILNHRTYKILRILESQ